jgi:hypothetical protein
MQEWMEFLLHFATESFYTKIRVRETRWRVLFSHTLHYIHMNYYFKLVCILFYKNERGIFRVPSSLVLDPSAILITSVLHFKEHDVIEGKA